MERRRAAFPPEGEPEFEEHGGGDTNRIPGGVSRSISPREVKNLDQPAATAPRDRLELGNGRISAEIEGVET
jgi:hypothetical protein